MEPSSSFSIFQIDQYRENHRNEDIYLEFESLFTFDSPFNLPLCQCESVEAKTTRQKRTHISILYLDFVDLPKSIRQVRRVQVNVLYTSCRSCWTLGGATDLGRDTEPRELIKLYGLRRSGDCMTQEPSNLPLK